MAFGEVSLDRVRGFCALDERYLTQSAGRWPTGVGGDQRQLIFPVGVAVDSARERVHRRHRRQRGALADRAAGRPCRPGVSAGPCGQGRAGRHPSVRGPHLRERLLRDDRGRRDHPVGQAAAQASRRAGLDRIAWNSKLRGRKARNGRYELIVTATTGGCSTNSSISLCLWAKPGPPAGNVRAPASTALPPAAGDAPSAPREQPRPTGPRSAAPVAQSRPSGSRTGVERTAPARDDRPPSSAARTLGRSR